MTFGSLFAGIGGFDLGLERAGMECRWQVELDRDCQRVLAKHWPNVRRWDDVRTFPPSGGIDGWGVDVICGGFPCQDTSKIGNADGIEGDQSGLWFEFARVIRELRPRFVIVENVPALFVRGFGRVLGELAELGFDAEWGCFPACSFGSPHIRERLWVIAYPGGKRLERIVPERPATRPALRGNRDDPGMGRLRVLRELPLHDPRKTRPRLRLSPDRGMVCQPVSAGPPWDVASPICRMVDGIPARVDRLRMIGNAIVPQVAEWLGRRLIEASEREDG